jgi:hypothetical protein
LPRLSSRLHSRVGWRASVYSCAPLARGQKPAGSPQAGEYRGLRLSQPAMPVLQHHRCFHPRSGRRWQIWPRRADPDLSLSSLPHHLHFQAQHALLSSENPLSCRVAVALSALAEGLDPSAAEPIDDGQRAKCSLAPCRRCPLERHKARCGCRVMLWRDGGRYPQKSSERASRWEEKASLDCLITKNAPEVDRERAGRFIHHI